VPMEEWEQIGILSGHRGLVLALAVYKDRLISGSDDRCIRVWRMGSAGAPQRGDWECERTLTGHNGGVVGVCFIQGAPPRRPAAPPPRRPAAPPPRRPAAVPRARRAARPDLRPTSS